MKKMMIIFHLKKEQIIFMKKTKIQKQLIMRIIAYLIQFKPQDLKIIKQIELKKKIKI